MTFEGLTIDDFGFTEVLDNEIPYHVAGYVKGVCNDPNRIDSYVYLPPKGWKITSCIKMPAGSHGVPDGQPCVLVWCEPSNEIIEINESPGLFPEIGGVPGFVAAAFIGAGLLVGSIFLAKRQK
jgi:hypothetical protein